MTEYIHGETNPHEMARLEHMAVFTAHFVLRDLALRSGQRVLDLACGVGAMTEQLANRCPSIHLFGVDIQMRSLHIAKTNHPIAFYSQTDGAYLPFSDNTFDFVHCSWLLEHVPSPLKILNEVYRVLKVGGKCQFIEVDNSSFGTSPEYPEVLEVMNTLCQIQIESGGDPDIGRRLVQLFQEAGFSDVDMHPLDLRGDGSDTFVLIGLTTVFANIFESVEQTLGSEMASKIRNAATRLRKLRLVEGGAIFYSPVVCRGKVRG
jgi:ubiquinone/menaquinone biosynthesis C-methylase UbiE